MIPTVVLDVVGLTHGMIGKNTPQLAALAQSGAVRPLETIVPAVTCPVQSTFVTGTLPRDHGCVGNGWYFRDLAEISFWRQSNHLVSGEKLWETARKRDPTFTCATLFWWFNMYASVDFSVTPRPIYWADGRKTPDVYTQPASLRDALTQQLGAFPLFHFWGPTASIRSSRWIADCARVVFDTHRPTLTLVYLPHLDYDLQRFGPDHPRAHQALREIDAIAGELIEHMRRGGARVIVLSEYGIVPVSDAVHINRHLREAGLLTVRNEMSFEKLDPGASDAFAVADHQVAHVYVRQPARIAEVRACIERIPEIDAVWGDEEKRSQGLNHPRSGDLVAMAAKDHWFSYYYWLDDARAPDFARTVDIHRKPGYDPAELFMDPSLFWPGLRVARKLAQKALGFRTLLDVIPLDASLVRGSHGRRPDRIEEGPLLITSEPSLLADSLSPLPATAVKDIVLKHIFDLRPSN